MADMAGRPVTGLSSKLQKGSIPCGRTRLRQIAACEGNFNQISISKTNSLFKMPFMNGM